MKHHCRRSQGGRYGIDDEDYFDVDRSEHYCYYSDCRDEPPESQGGSRAIDALSSNNQATIMHTACSTGLAPAIIDGGNEGKVKRGPWQTRSINRSKSVGERLFKCQLYVVKVST
jgi:hypothetical protein